MILKGRTRADGDKLAAYLLSAKNEQVRVLDIRGVVIDECSPQGLTMALQDMDDLGKMTRAKSSLFHLAINPDDRDRMTPEAWQHAIAKAEKALGLEETARVVVSHHYAGKEHLHVVWSRVEVEQRKCVEMSFSNKKLCQAAREIELDLGLQQTPARARGAHKLTQHVRDIQRQQETRSQEPRAQLNEAVTRAWHQSQDGAQFRAQIEAAGCVLAVGKRGVLVMDAALETHTIPRCVDGLKTKEVRAKLGDLTDLPSVEEVRARAKTRTELSEQRSGKVPKTPPRPTIQESPTQSAPVVYKEPTRRHGQNWTSDQHTRGLASSTEQPNGVRQDYVRMPWETEEQAGARAARAVASQKQQREDAARQSAAAPDDHLGLQRAKWESETQFLARVARAKAEADNRPTPAPKIDGPRMG